MPTLDEKLERFFDARLNRRLAAEDRAANRMDRRMDAADKLIDETENGKCFVQRHGGRYREGLRSDLRAYLMRNNYV